MSDLSTKSVLYLEDEILIGLDGELILKDIGFGAVYLCHTLEIAEDHLARQSIDFALLDINLGDGRSSLAFAHEVMERGIPIVFASGYNRSEELTRDFDVPVVVKPFSNSTIHRAVMQTLADGKPGE